MYNNSSKYKIMLALIFVMAAYFIGINFLEQIDKTNKNNTYVSLNLIYSSKEDYIEEYLKNIQDEKYTAAYNMLSNETKANFKTYDEYVKYAEHNYKNMKGEIWKLDFKVLSQKDLRDVSIYEYKVLNADNKDKVIFPRIMVYEYAVNVFKIGLE